MVFSDYIKVLVPILWEYKQDAEPGDFTFTENVCVQSQAVIRKPTLIIASGTWRPLSVKQLFQQEKKKLFGILPWRYGI